MRFLIDSRGATRTRLMREKRVRSFLNNRKGNIALMLAIMAPAFIGAVGLGVETGYWYHLQSKAQMAADVSAYAGAVALRNGETVDTAKLVAVAEAENLGYTATASATLTVDSPPLSGKFTTDRDIEVTINYKTPRVFSSIFANNDLFQDVRAVAGYQPPVDACVLALDQTASGAITISGSTNVDITGCEFMSNSAAADGFLVSGSGNLSIDCANSAGGFDQDGSSTVSLSTCTAPRTDLFAAEDPYASLPDPDTSGGCKNLTGTERNAMNGANGSLTISPGATGIRKFCNGLDLKNDVHFEPGIYIIDGKDFTTVASANVTGTDVTFYLTNSAEIGFRGTSTVKLTAPATGTYAGVLFFGDRNDITASHQFNGTADSLLTGTIYTPGSTVSYNGDFTGIDGCMQIIALRVDMSGGSNLSGDCTAFGINNVQLPGIVTLLE